MRIGTWNVAYGIGQAANSRRRRQIEAIDADIWVLTETHDDLRPGDHYADHSSAQRPPGASTVRERSRWVSIWTRLPFMNKAVKLNDPERTTAALIDCGQCALLVYGTVLPWYGDTERGGMGGALSAQAPEWASLPHEHGAPCCVAGDFNVNLGGPHVYGSRASKQLLSDALRDAELDPVTDHSHQSDFYSNTRTGVNPHGLVNHIALSPQLAATAKIVSIFGPRDSGGSFMSDHAGVVVELEWP